MQIDIDPEWADSDPPQAQALKGFLATEPFVRVAHFATTGGFTSARYSALLSADRMAEIGDGPQWEVTIGSGGYGLSKSREGDATVVRYERSPEPGTELLALKRDFHGLRDGHWELSEEFRLFFNLWEDPGTGTYYRFDDAGDATRAAEIEESGVRIRRTLLRQFQAAKQMHLGLYFDSTRFAVGIARDGYSWESPDRMLRYVRADRDGAADSFSRLHGKLILPPPPIEASGIWPFEEPRKFVDFIIGHDHEGHPREHTSDPDALANHFGRNPEAPNYLTPVFFKRSVLDKYYDDHDRYTVDDGRLTCAGLWTLRLDNDSPNSTVSAFLGDLGRDLPVSEAKYWRTFNIEADEQETSETLRRRAFDADFADPQSADLRFRTVYEALNHAWEQSFEFPLFLPLHDDDAHVLSSLRIPAADTQGEFDRQILYLSKLLVDSLNESGLLSQLPKKPKGGAAGLRKLEFVLQELVHPRPRAILTPIADVQGLRSRGAAHRKGSSYDLSAAIGSSDRIQGFRRLLTNAIATLEELSAFASSHADRSAEETPDGPN